MSCCKGKQTFPDGVTTAVKLLPEALPDEDINAGWLFFEATVQALENHS